MSDHKPSMFSRLRSLFHGFFGSWVRDREHQAPEIVYEQAIAERVRQYRELKSAVAGILYMRNKIESEIGDRRAEIARLHDDVHAAGHTWNEFDQRVLKDCPDLHEWGKRDNHAANEGAEDTLHRQEHQRGDIRVQVCNTNVRAEE